MSAYHGEPYGNGWCEWSHVELLLHLLSVPLSYSPKWEKIREGWARNFARVRVEFLRKKLESNPRGIHKPRNWLSSLQNWVALVYAFLTEFKPPALVNWAHPCRILGGGISRYFWGRVFATAGRLVEFFCTDLNVGSIYDNKKNIHSISFIPFYLKSFSDFTRIFFPGKRWKKFTMLTKISNQFIKFQPNL